VDDEAFQPGVANHNVCSFGENIIAIVTRFVFEEPMPPIPSKEVRCRRHLIFLHPVLAPGGLNAIYSGPAILDLLAEVDRFQSSGRSAELPCKKLGETSAFQMAANKSDRKNDPITNCPILNGEQPKCFDKAGDADQR